MLACMYLSKDEIIQHAIRYYYVCLTTCILYINYAWCIGLICIAANYSAKKLQIEIVERISHFLHY